MIIRLGPTSDAPTDRSSHSLRVMATPTKRRRGKSMRMVLCMVLSMLVLMDCVVAGALLAICGHIRVSRGPAALRPPLRSLPGARELCVSTCASGPTIASVYGRYCGYMHTGCPGTLPCDAIDECCYIHDMCVAKHGFLDCRCTVGLVRCAACVHHTINDTERIPGALVSTRDEAGAILRTLAPIAKVCLASKTFI